MHSLARQRVIIVVIVAFASAGVLGGTARSIHVQARQAVPSHTSGVRPAVPSRTSGARQTVPSRASGARQAIPAGAGAPQRALPGRINKARKGTIGTDCAVLGAYHIGLDLTPAQSGAPASPIAPTASSTAASSGPVTPTASSTAASSGPVAPAHAGAVYAAPTFSWQGTLILSGYSGCGQSNGRTAGTFSIQRGIDEPPIEQPRRQGAKIACPLPLDLERRCGFPALGVVSAVGRFTWDAMHPSDALYVTVSAVVTTTRRGPELGIPCSVERGCPPPTIITSTVVITAISGYLQATASDGRRVVLSFLPPPAADTSVVPTPLVLYGWRGGKAVPAPAPLNRQA